jgi:competence protein ComEC
MTVRVPYVLAGALCAGLASATFVRAPVLLAALLLVAAALGGIRAPLAAAACALAVAGWWWGSARLWTLDRSVLAPRVGTAARAVVEVQEPPRLGRFQTRVRALVVRWDRRVVREPVVLELPRGRAPPQGARLSVLGVLREPRGPSNGFDERAWLRRRGVHVVLRASVWRTVGSRDGLGGFADRLHARLARDAASGLEGERRAVVEGVVLGEDGGLSDGLKDRFRASGLYHLLAVSGGNVLVVAGGTLALLRLLGVARLRAEVVALAAIGGYVLAVGPQPSVIRAGIAGALGSLAWLSGRERDRWYALLLAAIALLAWNPYTLLEPGFQLSFAAVVSIFTLAPRFRSVLEGYPMPDAARTTVAISAACALATAPISWLHFHAIPLVAVPANAVAVPAVAPMLALALLAALLAPFTLSTVPAALAGWCAAYVAGCARFFGGLPGAQVTSGSAAAALLALVLLGAALASRRRPDSLGLTAPPESG